MMQKSVSVTIPNYNGIDLLRNNLPLLYSALKHSKADYEVIVADDASSDGSVAFIRSHYPEIILVEHTVNQGFSKNINSAIATATKNTVLLLNTDVELTEQFFDPLWKYFEQSNTFGVCAKVIGNKAGEIQEGAKYPTIGLISIRANINYLPTSESLDWLPTLFMSGGSSLVDRKKLLLLGAFDEIYSPFYSEDVDLCIRAWRAGYKCYFEMESVCKHPQSSTINKYTQKAFVNVVAKRNKMIFHSIHLSGWPRLIYLCVVTIKSFFRLVIGDSRYYEAFKAFRKLSPHIAASRQRLSEYTALSSIYDVKREILNALPKNITRF